MSESPSWQELLDLLKQWDESGLESASVQFGDTALRVSRTGQVAPFGEVGGAATADASGMTAPAPLTASIEAPASASVPPAPAVAPTASDTRPGTVVPAPMIGVFYRCPAPGKPEFVSPGDSVDADTAIGIIEVMKLMNSVTAGVAGTFLGYEVADGGAIEYGQALARIDPS